MKIIIIIYNYELEFCSPVSKSTHARFKIQTRETSRFFFILISP